MNHLVLLGDSILDNGAYVGGGPAVADQLRNRLRPAWRVSLLAVDGSLTADVLGQLRRLPPDATHLVVSAGGNDALIKSGALSEPAASVAEALRRLAALAEPFARDYAALLAALRQTGLPSAVCTVYDPSFPDPQVQLLMRTGLTIFNDAILRLAFAERLPVVDLRLVCREPAHYANEIEPSAAGGAQIADAIARVLASHDFARPQCAVYW